MKQADLQDLISANHILHYNKVVDAYGHVSLRHPSDATIFLMSGDKAPALVSSSIDLIQYHVSDSSPVDSRAKKGYQERFIHSEIYKRFPHINSVVHSHSEAVLPFTMNGVPMKPAFHIAGFLGAEVPSFDIRPLYKEGDLQNLLVSSERFGSALASMFSAANSQSLDHNVVLMCNHGFTAVGTSIKQAVYRAVYTQVNAGVQSNAIILRNAFQGVSGNVVKGEIEYLNEEQAKGGLKLNDASQDRPWGLWVREVQENSLYVNEARDSDPEADVEWT